LLLRVESGWVDYGRLAKYLRRWLIVRLFHLIFDQLFVGGNTTGFDVPIFVNKVLLM
jgi:hypothetical protein